MSQYPTCEHNWGDMLATCPKCDAEKLKTERDTALEHNEHMLKVAAAHGFECLTDLIYAAEELRKENENLLSLLKLAHEWGANGTKGYSASCAENFQRSVEHILSNVK